MNDKSFVNGGAVVAQTIESTKTEQYKASFENVIDIDWILSSEGQQLVVELGYFPVK